MSKVIIQIKAIGRRPIWAEVRATELDMYQLDKYIEVDTPDLRSVVKKAARMIPYISLQQLPQNFDLRIAFPGGEHLRIIDPTLFLLQVTIEEKRNELKDTNRSTKLDGLRSVLDGDYYSPDSVCSEPGGDQS